MIFSVVVDLGQMWFKSTSDVNGWFTLQNPTIGLFLTANGNDNPTIEGNTCDREAIATSTNCNKDWNAIF